MHIEKYFVNWSQTLLRAKPTQQILKQIGQSTNHMPKIWQELHTKNYSWTQAGLEQVQNLLQYCAGHSKQVQVQLKQLSHEASAQLIPVFKNQNFLKILADKMKLPPQTVKTIQNLLNKFTNNGSPFSPASLLIIVLFIAMGAQVPLLLKGSFSGKKVLVTVTTILDYVATALQLAQHFQKNKN